MHSISSWESWFSASKGKDGLAMVVQELSAVKQAVDTEQGAGVQFPWWTISD